MTADKRVRAPLLELLDADTRETDMWPGIDAGGRAVIRPDEMVLCETRSFPTVAVVDDDSGDVTDTFVADGAGLTTITDRRVIFVRASTDSDALGVFDDDFIPLSGDPAPASAPRPGPVVAGHVRLASVSSMSYQRHRRPFGSFDMFYFATRSRSSGVLISVRVRRAANDLCPRLVESLSVARRVDIPSPSRRRDGSVRWFF